MNGVIYALFEPVLPTYRSNVYLKASNVLRVFKVEEEHKLLNICPHRRAVYGIHWRTGKFVCTVPIEMAVDDSANAKASYQVNSHQSAVIFEETKVLNPVELRELFCLYYVHMA